MKHAVLTNEGFLVERRIPASGSGDGSDRRFKPVSFSFPTGKIPHHAGELQEIAQHFDIDVFWVWPGSIFDHPRFFQDTPESYQPFIGTDAPGSPESALLIGMSLQFEKRTCYVMHPYNGQWGWDYEKPIDVLCSAVYLERATGMAAVWGPASIGKKLLRECNKKHSEWLVTQSDLRALPFAGAGSDLFWFRPLEQEEEGWYVHAFDKNASYLAACQGGKYGIGTPEHVTGNVPVDMPGIYRVKPVETGQPPIFHTHTRTGEISEWQDYEAVRYALDCGYPVEITEAYKFAHAANPLASWASRMWNARQDVLQPDRYSYARARENVYQTIKSIYAKTLAGMRQKEAVYHPHKLLLPHLSIQVMVRARVNMLRNIAKIQQAVPSTRFFLIKNDCLLLVSSFKNPDQAFPRDLQRPGALGGYKYEGSARITQWFIEKSRHNYRNNHHATMKADFDDLAESQETEQEHE